MRRPYRTYDGETGKHVASTQRKPRMIPHGVSEPHHRRSVRLSAYDYTCPGAYFVTLCTERRACSFGRLENGQVLLNEAGRIAESTWVDIPAHFPTVELDAYVIMPDHVHGVILIRPCADAATGMRGESVGVGVSVGATHASPLHGRQRPHGPARQSIGAIVGSYKAAVTRGIRERGIACGGRVWQRNYHEHVVRDEDDLGRIRQYVIDNPRQPHEDAR